MRVKDRYALAKKKTNVKKRTKMRRNITNGDEVGSTKKKTQKIGPNNVRITRRGTETSVNRKSQKTRRGYVDIVGKSQMK